MPYFQINKDMYSLFCELREDQKLVFDLLQKGIHQFHYRASFTNDTYPPQIRPFLPTLQICYNYLNKNLQKFFYFDKDHLSVTIQMVILERLIKHQIGFQRVQNSRFEIILIQDREKKQLVLNKKPNESVKNKNHQKIIRLIIFLSFLICIWFMVINQIQRKMEIVM